MWKEEKMRIFAYHSHCVVSSLFISVDYLFVSQQDDKCEIYYSNGKNIHQLSFSSLLGISCSFNYKNIAYDGHGMLMHFYSWVVMWKVKSWKLSASAMLLRNEQSHKYYKKYQAYTFEDFFAAEKVKCNFWRNINKTKWNCKIISKANEKSEIKNILY